MARRVLSALNMIGRVTADWAMFCGWKLEGRSERVLIAESWVRSSISTVSDATRDPNSGQMFATFSSSLSFLLATSQCSIPAVIPFVTENTENKLSG
nr:hypothetical protein Iba_chr06aCG20210 [Ipomoea batatas]